jgi:predicted transposase YbfD/YdcC
MEDAVDDPAVGVAAVAESVVFLEYFEALPDPRQLGKVRYPLDEVLLLCLLAVLAGADSFVDIALFGAKKRALLRRFRPFASGTPSHDHLGDIFAALDPEAFQRCFVAWVAAVTGLPGDVIAIDGKSLRRSGGKSREAMSPTHIVSAFSAGRRLVLGQVKTAEKSNEITAIPKLLAMMDIQGATLTIDAMGCQRDIAEIILAKKADYILALKGNQGSLKDDVELFVAEQKAQAFKDATISAHETVDGDHGRIETRRTTVIHAMAWLAERHAWPGLKSIVIAESRRETGAKIETETRLFISSLDAPANQQGPIVRSHWAVENSLHWVMDMVFREDEGRVRTANAPANFALIRHMTQNLLRRPANKLSLRARRKAAAWDDDFLVSIIKP